MSFLFACITSVPLLVFSLQVNFNKYLKRIAGCMHSEVQQALTYVNFTSMKRRLPKIYELWFMNTN